MSGFMKKEGVKSVISSVLCILAGVLLGFIIMVLLALFNDRTSIGDAVKGLGILLAGPFSSGNAAYIVTNVGDMIFYSTPLIMTGLSVAIAYKTGLFNIGAAGQFYMGTLAALMIALNADTNGSPAMGFLVWLAALLTAMLAGMIWGAIPGFFKAVFNVNEVIVCIMTNWISANIVTWIFTNTPDLINRSAGKSGYLITTAVTGNGTPKLGLDQVFKGSYIDMGILVAIALAIVIYVILTKTTFGYELRACGSNKYGARCAGMNEKRNIIVSMAIAGGLAAIGGALYYLNPGIELKFDTAYSQLPSYGFNGIPVALLGSNNPIAVIFVGIFIRFLSLGGDHLTSAGYNKYISDIIVALIIYFAGFSMFFKGFITKLARKKEKAAEEAAKAAVQKPSVEGEKTGAKADEAAPEKALTEGKEAETK
ncbi:MAG: ABC transporter permease [Lachnospiraceae bacterium]|nr:ABC transporter permease [Lachnospiraceae bacterium]